MSIKQTAKILSQIYQMMTAARNFPMQLASQKKTDRQTSWTIRVAVHNQLLTGKTGSRVAIINRGMTSSTSANGPCFNSPAIMPSECRYVSSLIFCQTTQTRSYQRPQTSTQHGENQSIKQYSCYLLANGQESLIAIENAQRNLD